MSENVQKYENWRAITESDYVTMFIKTWFALVSIYSSWIEYYKKLLPLLTGLAFINHKKLIRDRIDEIQKRIVNAEVSEILENR